MKDRNGNRDLFARTFRNAGRFDGGGTPIDRHPKDINWRDWLLAFTVAAAMICIILGVTAWAPVGGTF